MNKDKIITIFYLAIIIFVGILAFMRRVNGVFDETFFIFLFFLIIFDYRRIIRLFKDKPIDKNSKQE